MIFSVSARQTVRLQEVDGCTDYLPGQYQVVKQSTLLRTFHMHLLDHQLK